MLLELSRDALHIYLLLITQRLRVYHLLNDRVLKTVMNLVVLMFEHDSQPTDLFDIDFILFFNFPGEVF